MRGAQLLTHKIWWKGSSFLRMFLKVSMIRAPQTNDISGIMNQAEYIGPNPDTKGGFLRRRDPKSMACVPGKTIAAPVRPIAAAKQAQITPAFGQNWLLFAGATTLCSENLCSPRPVNGERGTRCQKANSCHIGKTTATQSRPYRTNSGEYATEAPLLSTPA